MRRPINSEYRHCPYCSELRRRIEACGPTLRSVVHCAHAARSHEIDRSSKPQASIELLPQKKKPSWNLKDLLGRRPRQEFRPDQELDAQVGNLKLAGMSCSLTACDTFLNACASKRQYAERPLGPMPTWFRKHEAQRRGRPAKVEEMQAGVAKRMCLDLWGKNWRLQAKRGWPRRAITATI